MVYRTENGSLSGNDDVDQSLDIEALVLLAQRGNQRAFEMLYARYSRPIAAYLSRMVGNDGVGCELTQETFLKAWSALPNLRDPASFKGWLYRIASNCACTHQKSHSHMHMVPLDMCNGEVEGLSVEGPEEEIEKAELLQLALAQVSSTYRSCLILYVIEGLPQQQIAVQLNIKETSVSKYVSRGKEELRQIYGRLLRDLDNGQKKGRKGR